MGVNVAYNFVFVNKNILCFLLYLNIFVFLIKE